MKKMIVVSVLLVAVTFMSFASGFGVNGKRPLAEGVNEIAGLEKEYHFCSVLSYLGFTSQQFDSIIAAVENTKGSILMLEAEIKSDLQRAVELAKAGEIEKAQAKHNEVTESAKELFQIRNDYMDAIKGIVTVEQQEKMVECFQDKMSQGMQRTGQLSDELKERVQQRGTDLRDSRKSNNPMQKPQDTQKKMTKQRQMDNQRSMAVQKQMTLQKQKSMLKLTNQPFQGNLTEKFFQMLLMDENLDLLKEFMDSPAM